MSSLQLSYLINLDAIDFALSEHFVAAINSMIKHFIFEVS